MAAPRLPGARTAPVIAADSTLIVRATRSLSGAGSELEVQTVGDSGRMVKQSYQLPSAGKKTAFRFAVGTPGLRSTVWRAWSPGRGKNDVYVASWKSAGEFKFSFHESGDWRFAYTSQSSPEARQRIYDLDGGAIDGRLIRQWRRPPDVHGLIRLLDILVPEEDISAVPDDGAWTRDTRWVPHPPQSHLAEIRLVLIPDSTYFLLPGTETDWAVALLDGLRLSSGDTLLALVYTYPHSPELSAQLADSRLKARAHAAEAGFDTRPRMGARFMAIQDAEEGHAQVWDLALTWSAATFAQHPK